MTDPNPAPTAPAAPRPRGVLGFLFKTTLGCSAFALGSLVVLVLLLPTLLSGTVATRGAAAFDAEHQGRLAIGSASLAWFQEQTLRDVRLLDPAGAQVARASVTLPSILSLLSAGSGKIGAVEIEVEADLAADDAGTTNLQRALAPRAAAAPGSGTTAGASTTFDVAEFVRGLDLDLRVDVKRLAWSDADTRRLGRPFEIQEGVVRVSKVPLAPLVALVTGRIAGETPGTLEIHLDVDGPIDPAARWPLGRMEAKGRVDGFSTALVDGLAGLSGDLVEVLGPTFALRFDVAAESAEEGTARVELDGANADVAVHALLEGGVVRGGEQPFLTATTPMPRGVLERLLRVQLPPDASVTLAEAGTPWTVRVPKLRLPLPGPEARDLASLRPALEKAEIDLEVDLPGSATIETDALRAAQLSAGISAMKLTARAEPGQPLVAQFDAALDAGAPGRVHVEARVPDAFALLAGGPIPRIDAHAAIEGLSTLALGELGGQGGRIASAIGPVLGLAIDARQVNLDGGDVRVTAKSAQLDALVAAKIAAGVLTIDGAAASRIQWTPTPEFVAAEIGARLPRESELKLQDAATVRIVALSAPIRDARSGAFAGVDALLAGLAAGIDVGLPNVAWTSPQTRAAGAPAEMRAGKVAIEVAAGAPPRMLFGADLAVGSAAPARLEAAVRPGENLAALASGSAPSVFAEFKLSGLYSATLEKLAGQPDQIVPLFGPALDLVARVDGDMPTAGSLDVSLAGLTGRVELKGRVADGRFVAAGDEGLDATFQVTPELLRARLGPSLPAGTRVELAGTGPGAITVSVREFATPLEAPDVAQRLAGTSAKLEVVLPAIAYADAKTDAAKRAVVLSGAHLSAALSPTVKPSLRFAARVEDTPPGELVLDVTALDPLEKLKGDAAWKTFRASARVRAENVPTALVDALAGQDGLLVEALGPRILLDVEAPDVAFDRGTIAARVESGKNRVALAAHVDDGTLVVDEADGLDVDVALGPLVMDRVVGSLLPIFKKASFLGAVEKQQVVSSAEFAPFLLNSSDVRFALGSDVSKLNGVFRIDLGTLSFKGLPMLEQLGVSLDAADVRLPAFTVPIRDGVAVYEKLPIRMGGRDVLFDGSVRLVDGEMQLATKLPLAMFGQKFDRELAKIRDFVPPDTAVPIELRGTWNKPRVGFQDGFLEGLLESAAGKGLDDLLDGLLGGKKKKKKDG